MSFEFGLGFGRFHEFENSASVPSVLKICKIQSSFRPNGSTLKPKNFRLKMFFSTLIIILPQLTPVDPVWPHFWSRSFWFSWVLKCQLIFLVLNPNFPLIRSTHEIKQNIPHMISKGIVCVLGILGFMCFLVDQQNMVIHGPMQIV